MLNHLRIARATDSLPPASGVSLAGGPNESQAVVYERETASAEHIRPRHPFEFPPNEWMALFGVICLLLLAAMISVVVNKDVASIKQLFLILLADSVPDSARPGPTVPSPGSVLPNAPGDALFCRCVDLLTVP